LAFNDFHIASKGGKEVALN